MQSRCNGRFGPEAARRRDDQRRARV